MKKYHYVYKITNLNPQDEKKYYIGVRSSLVKPEDDKKYQSSSKYLKQALNEIGHKNFIKEILSVWDSRKLANKEEIRLHALFDVAKNPEFYNKAKALDDGFCTEGQVTVIDLRDGITKNVTIDEYRNIDYFKHCTKGQVTVIDLRDGTTKNVTIDEYRNNGYYESPSKNKVTVFDTIDQMYKMVSTKEYYESDNLIYHRSKTFKIYNAADELVETVYGNFERFCKENGYPFRVLVESYLKNGRKIYSNFSNPDNPKIKFKGWYAIKE